MSKKIKLVLVDGHALIHRAFHAIPELTTKEGELVNAVYGFALILFNMFHELKPTHVVVAFDLKKKTFRHKEYKEYKAKRALAPEELYAQVEKIKEIVRALNIPIYQKSGFEADDLIATLAAKASKIKKSEIIIVSGDLDALQLVDDKVKVYSLRRGLTSTIIYDRKQIRERYGLRPEQMNDFKALRGDPSDNIPGVPGIGEKTAISLLKNHNSLQGIFRALKENRVKVSARYQNLLKKHRAEAEFSLKLVTLVKNVPLKFDLAKAELHDFDRSKVVNIFQKLGFKSLLAKIPKPKDYVGVKQAELFVKSAKKKGGIFKPRKKGVKYKLIDQAEEIKKFLAELENKKEICLDVETDKLEGKLIGISFSFKRKEAAYLPWKETSDFQGRLKKILQSKRIKKIGHNLKYEYKILRRYGFNLAPVYFDTMIAAYLLEPGARNYNLDRLAFVELGIEMIPIESLISKGKEEKLLSQIPLQQIAYYSCEDADVTFRLYQRLKQQLKKKKLTALFEKIEMPLIPVISRMEERGIKIDKKYLRELSRKAEQKIKRIKNRIYGIAKEKFNINSTPQLRAVLFDKLQIEAQDVRRTKTGLSTAASELTKMRGRHKIIDLIFNYRELTKLKNTYLDTLPKLAARDGRVHTSFNQTITATGRLSSSNPNLQNIPIRTEIGNKIRKGFVAERGNLFLSVDYSQIELRVVAHLAGDKKMISAFKHHKDIHTATAAEIFEVDESNVTKIMRRVAKVVNFGVLYGLSGFGMSERIQISREEANKFIKKYFRRYPEIKKYVEEAKRRARKRGFAETIFGRRRLLPEINSGVFQMRSAAERMAVNMPVQGTAADIIKIAMARIAKEVGLKNKDCKLLLQVHDELLFEVKREKIKPSAEKIKSIMEGVVKLKVPLKVDLLVGRTWGTLRKIKTD